MKVQKKPVVVDAIKYNGLEDMKKIYEFASTENVNPTGDGESIMIKTLEGEMKALPGDYIIKGIRGEVYPCKPDIFNATYIKKPNPFQMNFSAALEKLKMGESVCRAGWYGKHFLTIIRTSIASVQTESQNEPNEISVAPFIAIFPQDGQCTPWLASQADLLADDWEVFG